MTINELIMKAFEYGPLAAVAVYLIWRQSVDYKGVCKRLNEVEDYIRAELSGLLKLTTKALEENKSSLDTMTETIKKCRKDNNG